MRRSRADVFITGGGTAGHVNPALAIARALVARGHDPARVVYVGARHGLERELVPPTGFPYRLLPGRGIVRSYSARNVASIAGLAVAFAEAVVLVGSRRPRCVVAVGGYGGLATGLAARLWRIPLVTVNVDAVAGGANRLLARFATASAVGFIETGLPRQVLTGVPIREEILRAERSPAARAAARAERSVPPTKRLVAVVGGSLGARTLNQAGVGLRSLLTSRDDLVVHHVAGARDYDAVAPLVATPTSGLDYRLVRYEDDMASLLVAADLVVARAGANTVAELRALGVPSILVPLPNAPSDHQTKNARALEAAGAAVVVADDQASPEAIAALVSELTAAPDRLDEMGAAARSGQNRDAAAAIAALVDDIATRAAAAR